MAKGFVTKIDVDLDGVTKKFSPAAVRAGQRAMADQIMLDTNDYVPKKDGDLRASAYVGSSGDTVSWNTVYARAQFYGKRPIEGTDAIVHFKKYTTPGTGKNWFVKAKNKHLDKWKETAIKEMKLKQ